MQEFLQIALSFPTVVFTALSLVLGLYWLMVILGALDLDLFDIELDFDMDGDVDFEMDFDVDADADVAGPGFLMSVAAALGLGTVPVTVVSSFWILTAWLISFASVFYLTPLIGDWSAWVATIFGFGSFLAAMPLTMMAMQFLIPVFDTPEVEKGGDSLIGRLCTVTTSKVTDSFGQADADDGGAGLILSVRCEGDNNLARGSKALIIDYDKDAHAYIIEPYDSLIGDDSSRNVVLSDETSQEAGVEERAHATATATDK